MTQAEVAEFRRKNNERQRLFRLRMKYSEPSQHRCGCGNRAVEWDEATKSFRCAACRAWESKRYGGDTSKRNRQYIEPFTIHLPYGVRI